MPAPSLVVLISNGSTFRCRLHHANSIGPNIIDGLSGRVYGMRIKSCLAQAMEKTQLRLECQQ